LADLQRRDHPRTRKRRRHTYTRFQAALPNECWQADVTHWPLAGGAAIEVHGIPASCFSPMDRTQ
jgi:hypothetical protein